MATVNKSKAGVIPAQLHNEITANATITTVLWSVAYDDPDIVLEFASALSGPEDTELDVVIAAHSDDGPDPVTQKVVETGDTSTTSTSYVVLGGLTLTPRAGTYNVSLSTVSMVLAKDTSGLYAICVDGTPEVDTEREVQKISGHIHEIHIPLHSQATVIVDGTEAIEARFKTSDVADAINAYERSLIIVRMD